MLKTLIKNQLYAVNRYIFENRKNKKRRSTPAIAAYAALYSALMIFLAVVFFGLGYLLTPLLDANLTWLYFAITGGLAIFMGVFGSVFNTYSSLYDAKDNDLLLSMPIPVKYVLIARISAVYILGAAYSGVVFVPTIIAFFVFGSVTVLSVFTPFIAYVLITLIVLCLSSGLGYVVAKISAKLKNKSFITVIISLAFFAAYYAFYAKSNQMITALIANGEAVAANVKVFAYPLYIAGSAAAGNILHTLIYLAAVALITFGVYKLLEKSFLNIVTYRSGSVKGGKKEKSYKQKPLRFALLCREFKRFTSSATYMLNCGLGVLVALIAAIAVIVKRGDIYELTGYIAPYAGNVNPLIAAFGAAIVSSMTYTAAVSVSLEGKQIYIAQSLPVPAWQTVKAKLNMQIILAVPTALFLAAALAAALKLTPLSAAGAIIFITASVILDAEFGLFINLKLPNLNWVNETAAVKSGLSVMFAMFFGWLYPAALFALFFAVKRFMPATVYLFAALALSVALCVVLFRYLKTKGSVIFENLKA